MKSRGESAEILYPESASGVGRRGGQLVSLLAIPAANRAQQASVLGYGFEIS